MPLYQEQLCIIWLWLVVEAALALVSARREPAVSLDGQTEDELVARRDRG